MVVGINEEVEVLAQLLVIVIVEVFDSGLLDCAVPLPGNGLPANREWDALDLTTIRENSPPDCFLILMAPRMVGLCQAMLNFVGSTDHVEAAEARDHGVPVSRLFGELDAPRHCLSELPLLRHWSERQWRRRSNGLIGQDDVSLVGNGFQDSLEKGHGRGSICLFIKADNGEF